MRIQITTSDAYTDIVFDGALEAKSPADAERFAAALKALCHEHCVSTADLNVVTTTEDAL